MLELKISEPGDSGLTGDENLLDTSVHALAKTRRFIHAYILYALIRSLFLHGHNTIQSTCHHVMINVLQLHAERGCDRGESCTSSFFGPTLRHNARSCSSTMCVESTCIQLATVCSYSRRHRSSSPAISMVHWMSAHFCKRALEIEFKNCPFSSRYVVRK